MGWWKVRGTEDVVGDDVFSMLRNAALAVAATYLQEWERPPTVAEWERLFCAAIEPFEDLESRQRELLIAGKSARPKAVHISLDEPDE